MDIETLKTLLAPELGTSLDQHWDQYTRLGQPLQAESFLAWLFKQKTIGFGQLEQVLTASPVEIGQMPSTSAASAPHQMLRQLGQGAMGVVHLAKDQALLRKVAYKQLLGEASLPVVRRFLNEVRITAQLEHPSIVPVYHLSLAPPAAGSVAGEGAIPQIAYTMKLVQGQTLKELLQDVRGSLDAGQKPDDRLNLASLLEIFLKVCDAMAYAHARQVIHRDLKPANLMIGAYGDVYVMDWGIARRFGRGSEAEVAGEADSPLPAAVNPSDSDLTQIDQTQAGQILGTPRYMSPQQAAGKNSELDGRSDLFALGLILFEILALKPAFTAANQLELLKCVLKAELQSLTAYHPRWPIPPELKAVVARATGRKIHERYAKVEEMSDDIRRYLRGERVSVYAEPRLQQGLRWVRNHARLTLLTILGVVFACLLVIGGSLAWQLWTAAANRQREAALSQFLSAASERAQSIDQAFFAYQGRLEGLAAMARQAYLQGQGGRFLYDASDFANPSRSPAGLAPAPAYGRPISLREPAVSKVSAQASPDDPNHRPSGRMLLQPGNFRDWFFSASGASDWAGFESLVRQQGLDLVWAHIDLKTGLQVSYPGSALAADEAPRGAWYRQADTQNQPIWGNPYPQGQQLLLPVIAPLRDPQGQLLGVACLELELSRLGKRLLSPPLHERVERVELLDPAGRVLLRYADATLMSFSQAQAPEPTLAAQLRRSPNGVMPLPQGGKLAWFRLSSLGWYFVVTAPGLR
ncbi:MAG TPA: protein kinase [Candidatus Obscuribacterales bacterium]